MTDGEGMERFWSHLSGYVKLTRSMSRANREMTLLDGARHFCEIKMERIGMENNLLKLFNTNKISFGK